MIEIFSNGGWMKNIDCDFEAKMWIDIKHIPSGGYNIFYACEPLVINRHDQIMEWIIENWKHFDLVLSHDDRILQSCPNAKPFHWTSALINENEYDICRYNDKKFQISFICGGKMMCHGHWFRRQCWEKQNRITIPKRLFYSTQVIGDLPIFKDNEPLPRNSKLPAFINSMFHLAMENCIIKGYFSEKLIDCFIARTVPIYYGCPNISDFFDVRGIIIVTPENMFETINNLTEFDFYSRIEFIEKNREKALKLYPINQVEGMKSMLIEIVEGMKSM